MLYESDLVDRGAGSAQTIISVGINLVDTLMVGALGETQLTAVSQASQLFFIFQLTLFGTTGGANVLIAQYWGKQDGESDPVGDRLYVPRNAEHRRRCWLRSRRCFHARS